jgi:hypothetical protein
MMVAAMYDCDPDDPGDQKPGMDPRALARALFYALVLWALMYACRRALFP